MGPSSPKMSCLVVPKVPVAFDGVGCDGIIYILDVLLREHDIAGSQVLEGARFVAAVRCQVGQWYETKWNWP